MSPTHALVVSLMLAPGLALAVAPVRPPSAIVFRFAPPDGTRVTQTYTQTQQRLADGQLLASEESHSVLQGEYRKVNGAYEYTQRLKSRVEQRDGKPVVNMVTPLQAQIDFVYVVGADGRLRDVRGYQRLETMVREGLPPDLAAPLAPLLNPATLVARDRTEWDGRYAAFAGGEYAVGDVVESRGSYPLPTGGALDYTLITRFPAWAPCPIGMCARVEQFFESDPKAVADIVNGVAPAAGATPAAVKTPRVTGTLQRLVDPATMRVFSERVERTLWLPTQTPAPGKTGTALREIRVYEFSYEH